MKNTIYIGNMFQVAEFIYHDESLLLQAVICEKEKLNDELFTFSILRGIPLHRISNVSEIEEIIKKYNLNVGIMCSFGKRIGQTLLQTVDLYNIHYSFLPYYKGRHPTFYAILNDEKSIGISLHQVTCNFDEGEIIAQELIPNYFWNHEEKIFEQLTSKIPRLLKVLSKYLDGKIESKNNEPGYYFQPVNNAFTSIDLLKDSLNGIYHKVRAQYKYGGCPLSLDEETVVQVQNVLFTPENIVFEGLYFYDENQKILFVKKAGTLLKIEKFVLLKGAL